MPIFDLQCNQCDAVIGDIVILSREEYVCPYCGGDTRKLITLSKNSFEQDPAWIKTVLEVVDKDSGKPHCDRFLKNPTRSNYRAWMKGEGLRPMENEHGAVPTEPRTLPEPDMKPLMKELMEKRRERKG